MSRRAKTPPSTASRRGCLVVLVIAVVGVGLFVGLGTLFRQAADPNLEACDAFAHYLAKGDGAAGMDRNTTVEQVRLELSRESDTSVDALVASGLDTLSNTVDGPAEAWVIAADTMANACEQYGWDPDA